jgi:hypothetical protein
LIGSVRGVTSSTEQPKKATRSPEQIEADLATTRARFTRTLDELSVRMQPDELGQDVSDIASAAAADGMTKAKEWAGLTEDSTGPRPELVGALAGAGLAILILIIRSRRAKVTYEFTLPNDAVRLEEVLVRAKGRKVPKALGGSAV